MLIEKLLVTSGNVDLSSLSQVNNVFCSVLKCHDVSQLPWEIEVRESVATEYFKSP